MNSLPEKIDKYELNDCLELLASLEKLIQYLETLMEQRFLNLNNNHKNLHYLLL